MGLVIGRVEVYAIPAGREKDLGPEGKRAVSVVKSWSLLLSRTIKVDAGSNFRSVITKGSKKSLTKANR